MRAVLLFSWSLVALTLNDDTSANPIRKVVKLLQDMQMEIEAEGEKEKDLFDKFMCYCHGNTDGMSKAAEEASQRITQLQAKLEGDKATKSQLDQELIGHKKDREASVQDLEKAQKIRDKEHADYVTAVGEDKENIEALGGAITALEKGMGKALLQAGSRQRLTTIVKSASLDEVERESVLSFLTGTQNPYGAYSGQSGEIVGILKTMKEEMDKNLNGAVADEEQAASGFADLKAAKQSEIAAAGSAIESKTKRAGALAVAIATGQDDIEDTTKELSESQSFLANLAAQCRTKQEEWDARSKTRAEEIAGISEAIKILNDDDSLDLFKKTLALSQKSLLQKGASVKRAGRAHDLIAALAAKSPHSSQLALIAYALQEKAVDFSKVIQMIEDMMGVLKSEQEADDSQKSFCNKDLASSANQKEDLEGEVEASGALISETQESVEMITSEVASLQAEVKELDKAVSDSTRQRQQEHEEFLTFTQENNAALELIEKAKNRLYKFYRPDQYKEPAPPAAALQEEVLDGQADLRTVSFAQVGAVHRHRDTPPPPPETWGAYEKKEGKSNGVLALMDNLAKELSDSIAEAKHDEETSQRDYESLMARSQATRQKTVESITNKEAAKADLDTKAERAKEAKASQEIELQNVKEYIGKLHSSCDFLLENYDLRKAARSNEQDSLANAKAVLSGANFS